jgi:hypothetical protein
MPNGRIPVGKLGRFNRDINQIDAPPLLAVETARSKTQGRIFRLALQLKLVAKSHTIDKYLLSMID